MLAALTLHSAVRIIHSPRLQEGGGVVVGVSPNGQDSIHEIRVNLMDSERSLALWERAAGLRLLRQQRNVIGWPKNLKREAIQF